MTKAAKLPVELAVCREPVLPEVRRRKDRQGDLSATLGTIEAETPDFGAALRAASLVRDMRLQAGLSQMQLGQHIGVSQARISEIEAGLDKPGPSFTLMEKIATACGKTIFLSAMLGRSDSASASQTLFSLGREQIGKPKIGDVDTVAVVEVHGKLVKGVVQAGTFLPFNEDLEHQSVRVRLKGFDHRVVDQTTGAIAETARRTGALIRGPIPLPTHIDKFTVNCGPRIGKKAREQFEVHTYNQLLDIVQPTPQTVDALMKLDLLAGVEISLSLGVQLGSEVAITAAGTIHTQKQAKATSRPKGSGGAARKSHSQSEF